jgi:hypothetical protein
VQARTTFLLTHESRPDFGLNGLGQSFSAVTIVALQRHVGQIGVCFGYQLVYKYARIKSVLLFLDFIAALMTFNDVAPVVVESAEDGHHAAIGAGQGEGFAWPGIAKGLADESVQGCRFFNKGF